METQRIRLKVTIKKVTMNIKFPCSLTLQLKHGITYNTKILFMTAVNSTISKMDNAISEKPSNQNAMSFTTQPEPATKTKKFQSISSWYQQAEKLHQAASSSHSSEKNRETQHKVYNSCKNAQTNRQKSTTLTFLKRSGKVNA